MDVVVVARRGVGGWVCGWVSDPSESHGKRIFFLSLQFLSEEDAASLVFGAVPGAKTKIFHIHNLAKHAQLYAKVLNPLLHSSYLALSPELVFAFFFFLFIFCPVPAPECQNERAGQQNK